MKRSGRGDIKEIIAAFKRFEKTNNSYFELNISCPNLPHAKELDLEKLLSQVDKLKIKKPVFVKMPINKSDKETLELLKVISKHTPQAVIFGNLQKDRNDKSLNKSELAKFPVGNFSGKPTFERSNQLIKLAYKNYKKRFVIIGCGGVFSANDAYTKIKLGASLVQLITGMIFEGPFLISEINEGLDKLLTQDGYENIFEAIGTSVQ
jgi:dihydroorotate dehydrogenase